MGLKLKKNPIDVPGEEPFRNDMLDRKQDIENLTNLILSSTDSVVFAVNGEWGSGKTTFLNMWKAYLDGLDGEKETATAYFSAWENDYDKDPLVGMIHELSDCLENEDSNPETHSKLHEFRKRGKKLFKLMAPSLIGLASGGILNSEGIGKALEEFADKSFNEYKKIKESVQGFKEKLQEFIESLDGSKRLVFFIDELDRCKPLYSIQLLEYMKHFFDVPGVVFVLGINIKELVHSIKCVYGADFDGEKYLSRFIDIRFNLTHKKSLDYIKHIYRHFGVDQKLIRRFPNNASDALKDSTIVLTSQRILEHHHNQFPPRRTERFVRDQSIVLRMFPDGRVNLFFIPCFLAIKYLEPEAYESLYENTDAYTRCVSVINPVKFGFLLDNPFIQFESFLLAILKNGGFMEEYIKKQKGIMEEESPRDKTQELRRKLYFHYLGWDLDYLSVKRKFDLVDQIQAQT